MRLRSREGGTLVAACAIIAVVVAWIFRPPDPPAEFAEFRFVDVGPGLCVVATFPGDQHLLFDAGHYGSHCLNAVREVVTDGVIELVVISHPDLDHINDLPAILGEFRATTILHPGHDSGTQAWRRAAEAIALADSSEGGNAHIIDLALNPIEPGRVFQLGDATVTFIAGWSQWDNAVSQPRRNLTTLSDLRNVISIVVRVDYGGRSVLLTGDSKGRRAQEPPDACFYAQRVMVDRSTEIPLAADVMTASHHGARNGDATCFIEAVNPSYVIVSAGSHGTYRHPHAVAIQRYIDFGVTPENIFRTDRGDDEGEDEWDHLRVSGCRAQSGFDDVIVRIFSDPAQPIDVAYLNPETPDQTAARLREAGRCD